jgi:hypothetical protein
MALDQLDGPIFFHTGTRASNLWAICQAEPGKAEEVTATAEQAGYDLAALQPGPEARVGPCTGSGLWTKCSNTMTLMAAAKKHQTEMNQAV